MTYCSFKMLIGYDKEQDDTKSNLQTDVICDEHVQRARCEEWPVS